MKKLVKEDEPKKETEQLTFLEEEHKSLVDYMNFVSKFAKFGDMGIKEMHEMSVSNIKAINVVKKIELYIFEHKKTVMKPKEK